MFLLSSEEWSNLKSQFATSSLRDYGGIRKIPYAFTEQGVAMLWSVNCSKKSVEVNIEIMRAFVRLRQLLTVNKELAERILKLEAEMVQQGNIVGDVEGQIQKIFGLLQQLFNPLGPPNKKTKIGFRKE